MTQQDTGYAADTWAFDTEVTRVFDDMLKRSIPNYDGMREAISGVARQVFAEQGVITDLGTSRGETISHLLPCVNKATQFIGLEISEPMVEAATERFINNENVRMMQHDLLTDTLPETTHITSCLSLMFTPIEDRPKIVGQIASALADNGVFLLVEKVAGMNGVTDEIFTNAYYDMKREHGYSDDAIQRKRLSLRGVLVPQTAKANEDMLVSAGFRTVECFWRTWNFVGWIAKK